MVTSQTSLFAHLPPGSVFARLSVVPGQVTRLVSVSGSVLVPGSWSLVVSLAGGWLVLVPASPAPAQPILF